MLKHLADALVGPGRALEVLVGADLLADFLTLERSVSVCASSRPVSSNACLAGKGHSKHTSSGETGFWLVFLSSSIVLGSYRRSFLQPTRMTGRPWQK